jgi:hypothetical protein
MGLKSLVYLNFLGFEIISLFVLFLSERNFIKTILFLNFFHNWNMNSFSIYFLSRTNSFFEFFLRFITFNQPLLILFRFNLFKTRNWSRGLFFFFKLVGKGELNSRSLSFLFFGRLPRLNNPNLSTTALDYFFAYI